MDDLVFYLAVAVQRLGGELRITDADHDAFDADDRVLKLDLDGDDTILTVVGNDMGTGVTARMTALDGTVVTIREGE